MFNSKDLEQITKRNISLENIYNQIECLKNGFPYIELLSPATIDNGLKAFCNEELIKYCDFFENSISKGCNVIKFVPASGAATRMFKSLYSFVEWYNNDEESKIKFDSDKSFNSIYNFIINIDRFAFYEDLKNVMKRDEYDIINCIQSKNYSIIIDYLLDKKGLGYGSLPKGLLKFHKYPDKSVRTAIEEHLVEGANYCKKNDSTVSIHFTISPEHIEEFKSHINSIKEKYEAKYKIKFIINFSIQKSSTDTISVDLNNNPFREKDGSIHFRPAGHGALLENLNELESNLIFIKNIDNVVPDNYKETTYIYKKALGGYLLFIQNQIKEYINILEKQNVNEDIINEITSFAKLTLCLDFDNDFNNKSNIDKTSILFSYLNKPIRVCGMVKNAGEPGGGPFWIKENDDLKSLQIVESSQIDFSIDKQKEIFNASTHFNPVDLVCGVEDYKGNPINLLNFTNPNTGFISIKSKDGKELKALELPGLWNGAMAKWITIFVEIPLISFNPVKTVNDLIRKEHLFN